MREDMFKIIVERPRQGRSWATKSKLRYDPCKDRSRVSGKRLVKDYGGNTKHLNENLAPLKRYLFKQRGRRWDDVFSEICARLDTGSTVKMHVREHLDDFILRKVTRHQDGTLSAASRWGSPERPEHWWADLYVDPCDGLIKETRVLCRKLGVKTRRTYWRTHFRPVDRPVSLKPLSETEFYAKVGGIWYQFMLNHAPVISQGRPASRELIYETLAKGHWDEGDSFRVISKRQLSKKQLKAYGLSNDLSNVKADYYD